MILNPSPLIPILEAAKDSFHPVVSFDPAKDKLLQMDFTSANKEITNDILDDTEKFIRYINKKLNDAGGKFGIGGYNELREVYSRSKLFSSALGGQKGGPRRLHLGIDIWGKPYTPVMSPMDGIVHSFAFNNNFGDYGATLILTHN